MKALLTLCILFLGSNAIAQNIEKNLSDFSELKAYDKINVKIIKGNENKAIISGDNMNDVEITNEKGTLRIRMTLGDKFDGDNTNVTVYYKSIAIIDANEGAKIASDELLKQEKIELSAQEGSEIKLKIDVEHNQSKAVTGGVIELSGQAINQDVSLNTGGKFYGKTCTSETTIVAVRAAGIADVYASKLVDAKVRAGGSINIYGKPETINESKVFGGSINRMD